MSIDKIPEKNINNNSKDPWAEFVNNNQDIILLTIKNLQFLWVEFWKVWDDQYKRNTTNGKN